MRKLKKCVRYAKFVEPNYVHAGVNAQLAASNRVQNVWVYAGKNVCIAFYICFAINKQKLT